MSRSARTGWLLCLLQQLPVSSLGVQMLERNGSSTVSCRHADPLRDSLLTDFATVHLPIDTSHRDSSSSNRLRDSSAPIDTSHRDSPPSNRLLIVRGSYLLIVTVHPLQVRPHIS